MSPMTVAQLQEELNRRDDGVLKSGKHVEGHEFCALEFDSVVRERTWSDAPITLPDIRPLNDARWVSNQARTAALLPIMVAYWTWAVWSPARRKACMSLLVIKLVRHTIAELPGLSEAIGQQCRSVSTLEEAKIAAYAASAAFAAAASAAYAAASAASAAYAAASAASAAASAAYAAASAAAGATILQRVCQDWIDAATETADVA